MWHTPPRGRTSMRTQAACPPTMGSNAGHQTSDTPQRIPSSSLCLPRSIDHSSYQGNSTSPWRVRPGASTALLDTNFATGRAAHTEIAPAPTSESKKSMHTPPERCGQNAQGSPGTLVPILARSSSSANAARPVRPRGRPDPLLQVSGIRGLGTG